MKTYQIPEIEMTALNTTDLITTSLTVVDADDGDDWDVGAMISNLSV